MTESKLTVIDKCSICMQLISKEVNPHFINNECNHQCCKKCLLEYLKMEIKEKHLKIKCFSIGCQTYLSDAFIKLSLVDDSSLFNQYISNFPKFPVVPIPQMDFPKVNKCIALFSFIIPCAL